MFINISKNLRFVFKSGCKGKGFYFNCQTFRKFFFVFSFSVRFSGSLGERERRDENDKRETAFLCESDCKDKNFIYYNPNFSGSFLFLQLSGPTLCHHVNSARLSSPGKRVQKYSLFGYAPNIFHYFFEVFWKGKDKLLKHNEVTGHFF